MAGSSWSSSDRCPWASWRWLRGCPITTAWSGRRSRSCCTPRRWSSPGSSTCRSTTVSTAPNPSRTLAHCSSGAGCAGTPYAPCSASPRSSPWFLPSAEQLEHRRLQGALLGGGGAGLLRDEGPGAGGAALVEVDHPRVDVGVPRDGGGVAEILRHLGDGGLDRPLP